MSAQSAPPNPSISDPSERTGFGFAKSSRILRRSDFRRVYDDGSRHTCPFFAAFYLRTEEADAGPRIGFTVPRAVGKSVARNRIRRRMREAVRLRLSQLSGPWMIVINPRRNVLNAPFESLGHEVDKLFAKCNQ